MFILYRYGNHDVRNNLAEFLSDIILYLEFLQSAKVQKFCESMSNLRHALANSATAI